MYVPPSRAKAAKIGFGLVTVLLGVLVVKRLRKHRKTYAVRPPNPVIIHTEAEIKSKRRTLSVANSWLAMWCLAFSAAALMMVLIIKSGNEMYDPAQPNTAGIYAILMGILFPCSWIGLKLAGTLVKPFLHPGLDPDGGGWAVYQGYLIGLLASGMLLRANAMAVALFVLVATMWPYFWRKPKQN